MRAVSEFPCILFCRDHVDFRKGRKGLASMVQNELEENPFSDTLFVFFNRRRTAVKCLYWAKNGFALWEKGLEKERFAKTPKNLGETVVLAPEQAAWLLEGFDIWKMKPHEELHYSFV